MRRQAVRRWKSESPKPQKKKINFENPSELMFGVKKIICYDSVISHFVPKNKEEYIGYFCELEFINFIFILQ
jgi:hypothetical protein